MVKFIDIDNYHAMLLYLMYFKCNPGHYMLIFNELIVMKISFKLFIQQTFQKPLVLTIAAQVCCACISATVITVSVLSNSSITCVLLEAVKVMHGETVLCNALPPMQAWQANITLHL